MNFETMAKVTAGSLIYGVPCVGMALELSGVEGTIVDLCSVWFVISVVVSVFVYAVLMWSDRNSLRE
ncbi:MAG TPA: hypothetical protein HA349_11310 [Methanotrichaceae archaeon]|nr:hypothetical protein [Methanotrichaceae archaeon]